MGIEKFRRKVVAPKGQFRDTINCIKEDLSATATPCSIANPLGSDVIILAVVLDITACTTATPCTLDVGCEAVSGASDNIIDGLAVGTPVTGIFNSANDKGTDGAMSRKWEDDKYLNVRFATGTPTGLDGTIYVWYRKA